VGDRHVRSRRAVRRGPLLRPRADHAREGVRGAVRGGPAALSPAPKLDVEREQAELQEYLGDDFELARLQRYQETLDDEYDTVRDEERFYRLSRGYLYNLTAFAMTATKMPYLEALTRYVPEGSRVLDYGCGIGSDGLMLLEAGYRVEFADFDNPSTEYLRWRLARRGLDAPVHDLDRDVPGGFDAAYAFDVIEHVPDPFAFLGEMESRSRAVVVNFVAPGHDEQPLHHELPLGDLMRHAARRRLLFYRVHYGAQHLVIYESREAGPAAKVASRGRLHAGRLRARLGAG
jgi:SAM-dependent methyltransferase